MSDEPGRIAGASDRVRLDPVPPAELVPTPLVEATRQAIEEARDRKLAEVRSLLAEAERESARVADRLARIRRDYTEGHLDVADWQSFRAELRGALHDEKKLRAIVKRLEERAR
jgi:hypothetical protein